MPTGRPSGAIAEDGSWRFRQRQSRGTKWIHKWYHGHVWHVQHFLLHSQVHRKTYSKICPVRFLDSYQIVRTDMFTFLFSALCLVQRCWGRCSSLGWFLLNVATHDIIAKISVVLWESMRLSTLRRLAMSSNGIKMYQDLPPWVNMAGPVHFGNQTWQMKGPVFKRSWEQSSKQG